MRFVFREERGERFSTAVVGGKEVAKRILASRDLEGDSGASPSIGSGRSRREPRAGTQVRTGGDLQVAFQMAGRSARVGALPYELPASVVLRPSTVQGPWASLVPSSPRGPRAGT